MLSVNKHVTSVKRTIEVSRDNNVGTILEVTTDIELDVNEEGFDSSALDDIVDDLVEAMKNDQNIDRGVIKSS